MKKLSIILLMAVCLLSLISCDAPGVYLLDDSLPPLMDVTTQYPYVTSIEITDSTSGEVLEFTEGGELDSIRMRFEGIKYIREKASEGCDVLYSVVFHTTGEDFRIDVISSSDFIIGQYHCEVMRSGVDLLFFDGLFGK